MTDALRGQVSGSAAEVYERLFVPAIFGRWPPVLLDAAHVRLGDRVLDVGCGTGVLAAAASRRVAPEGSVVGLDPNEPMLAVARGRPEPVAWQVGSAEHLPFADASFDRVVSQFALMYFADRSRAVAECARVTSPGGSVAFATWASLEQSPGYAALVAAAERTVGGEAVAALSAPFGFGEPAELRRLLAAEYDDVDVRLHQGTAGFASIDEMVSAEMQGWTLGSAIDGQQYDRLLSVARDDLAGFTGIDGRVEFAMPAIVATGRR